MNEPTDNPQIPPTVTALVELLTETAGDPTLAELHGTKAMWMIYMGRLSVTFYGADHGELLARCQEQFGGTLTTGEVYRGQNMVEQVLTTEWQGLPLKFSLPIARQSIETQLRARIAELEAAAAPATEAEVRDQVADVEAAAAESAQATV